MDNIDAGLAAAVPREFLHWLESLHLSHYVEVACRWWDENGAATIEEVFENWEAFSSDLNLKPLERKRIEKDVVGRAASGLNQKAMTVASPGGGARIPGKLEGGHFGPPEDPLRYTLLEEIGFGVTSRVYRCQRGQDIFAVKSISLTKLRRHPGFTRICGRLYQEISMLLSLKHERVVKLVDVVEEHEYLYLVMELVQGGELGEWIAKTGSFSEFAARHIFVQILEGLSYIHSKDIIHRDLKPDNILVDDTETRGEMLAIKLADFGASRLINDGYNITLTARVGTAMYWAPEISDPVKAALGYDQTADLWSLGVILYVMLIGFFPFPRGDHAEEQLQVNIDDLCFKRRASGPELSPEAQSLILSLIRMNPSERLTLKQCFSHPWVAIAPAKLGLMKLATHTGLNTVEVRVPFSMNPSAEELQALRLDLQKWMHKFKYYAAIKRGECIANLGDASDIPDMKAARSELQAIVERHCGRGMIVVNDQRMWTAIAESRSSSGKSAAEVVASGELNQERGKHIGTPSFRWVPCAASLQGACTSNGVPSRPKLTRTPLDATVPDSSKVECEGSCLSAVAQDGHGIRDNLWTSIVQDERTSLAALQGLWAHQADARETYKIQGSGVVRMRERHGNTEKRNYTLRWNSDWCCLEWGSGKYILQQPLSVPLNEAIWVPVNGGSRGFTWRRLPEVRDSFAHSQIVTASTVSASSSKRRVVESSDEFVVSRPSRLEPDTSMPTAWKAKDGSVRAGRSSEGKDEECASHSMSLGKKDVGSVVESAAGVLSFRIARRSTGVDEEGCDDVESQCCPSYTFFHTLRVDPANGAGLNMKGKRNGMRVKSIHPTPGQPGLHCEDLIQKIDNVVLSGTPKEVEETFRQRFRDGAILEVRSRAPRDQPSC